MRVSSVVLALGATLAVAANGGCSAGFDDCSASRTCKGPAGAGMTGGAGDLQSAGQGGYGLPGSGGADDTVSQDAGGRAGALPEAMAGEAGQGGGDRGAQAGDKGTANDAGSSDDEAGAGGERSEPDTKPPTVQSVVPSDGAHAVRTDADIVVTFSEPMDRLETEAAFVGDAFLPSHTSFSWSDDGTVMTVHSPGSLEYADPSSADALSYSFSITTFARDLAGNHLVKSEDVTFDTGRVRAGTLELADGRAIRRGVAGPDQILAPCVGSFVELTNNDELLLTFSFDSLAASATIIDFRSAELLVSVADTNANPMHGDVVLEHVSIDPTALSWDPPLLGQLGSLSYGGSEVQDVTEAIRDDWLHETERSGYTQYLVRFLDTSASQNIQFVCTPGFDNVRIDVAYVAP